MNKQFSEEDFKSISTILGEPIDRQNDSVSWKVNNADTRQTLILTIYNCVPLGNSEEESTIISVQNNQGYFELHNCTHYLIFEPDEAIFIEAGDKFISSLIIGQTGTVSMFSNIKRSLLRTDITQLDAPLLLSAMQLSLADSML